MRIILLPSSSLHPIPPALPILLRLFTLPPIIYSPLPCSTLFSNPLTLLPPPPLSYNHLSIPCPPPTPHPASLSTYTTFPPPSPIPLSRLPLLSQSPPPPPSSASTPPFKRKHSFVASAKVCLGKTNSMNTRDLSRPPEYINASLGRPAYIFVVNLLGCCCKQL
ncbi:unnamed protein product [Protopolystoma xenopodis]|uniref:Uncharacterized protein n=1 Tax=Protopolystoma xenopodis TaxID=117903 RepID=A0A3S4ZMF9_9PLAT|nr:unnamed protein product [Protopolystoma xenopodis]